MARLGPSLTTPSVQETLDRKAPVLVFVATRTGALEHSRSNSLSDWRS